MSHTAYVVPNLPYPVHRLATLGWFGVQLFFLASCITLLRSWHRERRTGLNGLVPRFFLRRLCRIVPAYYVAAIGYGLLTQGANAPGLSDVLRTLSFSNALSPAWAWQSQGVVPGGWSIGVEFAFYALFPLLAATVTSLRASLLAFAGSVLVGIACNHVARAALAGSLAPVALDNGLFFWFPNQFPVFTLGAATFFVLASRPRLSPRAGWALALVSAALCCGTAYVELPHSLGQSALPPRFLLVSVGFCPLTVALSASPPLLVNRAVAALGRVSFSAYLIHFAVLYGAKLCLLQLGADPTGWAAIGLFALALPGTLLVTFGLSRLTYRLIEAPGIELARTLTSPVRQLTAA